MKKQKHNEGRQGVRTARAAKEKAQKRKRFLYIILFVLVILGIATVPRIVKMQHTEDDGGNITNEEPIIEETQEPEPEETTPKEEMVDASNIPSSYGGYPVIRKYIYRQNSVYLKIFLAAHLMILLNMA